jgi:hypothetical protein
VEYNDGVTGVTTIIALRGDVDDEIGANAEHCLLLALMACRTTRRNYQLRRWRFSEYADTAPVLGEIFASSFDTLQLFRDRKWWRSDYTSNGRRLSRPSSFSLSELHSHLFDESITNSHNAVGDIRALDRLLLSKQFVGWETIANEIQIPFVKVDK